MKDVSWAEVVERATATFNTRGLSGVYHERLLFEIAEIEKQGAESIWVNRVRDNKKYVSNPNSLVLPWLLEMVSDDPITSRKEQMLNTVRASKIVDFKNVNGYIPKDLIKDSDSPDIDIDCLPDARDPLKEYAIQRYGQDYNDGYGSVCSVGTWQTYKFKQAIIDAAIALGTISPYKGQHHKPKKVDEQQNNEAPKDRKDRYYVESTYTTKLPDDVDELKEGGKATCKGKVRNAAGDEKDCGHAHAELVCEKCGSRETDGPTIAQLLQEHDVLQKLNAEFPDLIYTACNLVGRVRNMGMHAGAIIITNRPLYGNIPLARSSKKGYWVSMWTEGRNTQLSKFGYIKWDWLGLKTLQYIFQCCKLIEENRGISFGPNMSGWDDINPQKRQRGHFFDGNGNKHYISLDDPFALRLANEQKTDGIFQFDTDLAKSILANGVRTFEDLLFFNAAGHPGPMASIPEAVKNRDDTRGIWKKRLKDIHPTLLEILQDTYGIILWQEQLAAIWQRLGGFTSPEAQEARKAVAKKWAHKLKPIGLKWINGATPNIGQENAEKLWESMVTFGRYAFNRSHGVSYCLVAYQCLWLKAHFAPEWWASIMSDCKPDKLVRYMGVARAEGWEPTKISYCGKYKGDGTVKGVKFSTTNVNNLTEDFTVTGDTINQGLIGIKGIGKKAAKVFTGKGNFTNVDEFVDGRKSKSVMERFIKLGAFKHLPGHENTKALWTWYQYKYCKSGKDMTALRNEIRATLLKNDGWTEESIKKEITRQAIEYRRQYPKRSKIPLKITNWRPKVNDAREQVINLIADDYALAERLEFQKKFLGYWIDSPLDQYNGSDNNTIAKAKEAAKNGDSVILEGIIVDVQDGQTKRGQPYLKIFITDGIQKCLVFMWSNELALQDFDAVKENQGVRIIVDYDEKRGTFAVCRGETVNKLTQKDNA